MPSSDLATPWSDGTDKVHNTLPSGHLRSVGHGEHLCAPSRGSIPNNTSCLAAALRWSPLYLRIRYYTRDTHLHIQLLR